MKTLTMITVALLLSAGAAARAADVSENWEKHCVSCHGKDGRGETKMGKKSGVKDYTDPKVQAELKEDRAIKILKEGLKEGDKTKMKPFGDILNEAEMKALIDHIRKFKK